jgi:hypothetical protein
LDTTGDQLTGESTAPVPGPSDAVTAPAPGIPEPTTSAATQPDQGGESRPQQVESASRSGGAVRAADASADSETPQAGGIEGLAHTGGAAGLGLAGAGLAATGAGLTAAAKRKKDEQDDEADEESPA